MYAFDAKYSPMGIVTIRIVKNSSVFRADTKEPSFLWSTCLLDNLHKTKTANPLLESGGNVNCRLLMWQCPLAKIYVVVKDYETLKEKSFMCMFGIKRDSVFQAERQ